MSFADLHDSSFDANLSIHGFAAVIGGVSGYTVTRYEYNLRAENGQVLRMCRIRGKADDLPALPEHSTIAVDGKTWVVVAARDHNGRRIAECKLAEINRRGGIG